MIPIARAALVAAAVAVPLAGCMGEGSGPPELVFVPTGASFTEVTDSLAVHHLVAVKPAFRLLARLRGADKSVKAGSYRFRRGTGWAAILSDLEAGRVVAQRLIVPEAWDIRDITPRIAAVTRLPADSVFRVLADSATAARFGVPGPTLEGYLYPATYEFPIGVTLDSVLSRMTSVYERTWTPERAQRADSIGMSRRDVVTLASIVEKEAKIPDEMPLIASVYENRLRRGMLLQADPTVQYALGIHRDRLLYAAIDSVAANPYNTYRHPGLPPGPIASPSARAIDAVLHPDSSSYLYFVATPAGTHVFSRTLDQHNLAKERIRRQMRRLQAQPDSLNRGAGGRGQGKPTAASRGRSRRPEAENPARR